MAPMIETARNSVQTWEIDRMGHMNVQFYVHRAMEGLSALAIGLGLGREYARSHNQSMVATDQHIRFLHECRVGTPFYLHAGILDVAAEQMMVYQEMVESASGEVLATYTTNVDLRDVASHAICAFPHATRKQAAHLSTDKPWYGRAKGLTMHPAHAALTLDDANAMGLVPTFQGVIHPDQCDSAGWLLPRHFIGIVSNVVPNLLAHAGGEAGNGVPNVGNVALEYRLVYRRYPRVDDVVTLRSALTYIGAKTYVWCHWLFDLETGKALASAEAVVVLLDLELRKTIQIPNTVRAQLEKLLVPGGLSA